MSAEVICIGTELLLGDILNTNCQYLAKELADLGIPHYYQTVVGDNLDRVHRVIATAVRTLLYFDFHWWFGSDSRRSDYRGDRQLF